MNCQNRPANTFPEPLQNSICAFSACRTSGQPFRRAGAGLKTDLMAFLSGVKPSLFTLHQP